MFKGNVLGVILSGLLILSSGVSTAATLGLTTDSPRLGASDALMDYFEFSTDGDLSSFGSLIDSAVGVSPAGLAEISFGFGFDLLNPTVGGSGGFDIFDNSGIFLAGDLLAVGFREDLIELQFNNLTGFSASSFNASVLLEVLFDEPLGLNPFESLSDGSTYSGQLHLSNVISAVPVPATFYLMLLALGLLSWFELNKQKGPCKRPGQIRSSVKSV